MAAIVLVAAAGMFVLGVVAGIVAVVSHGIHREQLRLRGAQDIWAGPDAPDYFLSEQAPDVVSGAARRLTGLYVHRLPRQPPNDDGCRRWSAVMSSRHLYRLMVQDRQN